MIRPHWYFSLIVDLLDLFSRLCGSVQIVSILLSLLLYSTSFIFLLFSFVVTF